MVERTAVFPAGRHSLYAEHRYSAAIRSGDLLFVSGQVGSREDGTPEPDFQQQVRLAFDNLHATLQLRDALLTISLMLRASIPIQKTNLKTS